MNQAELYAETNINQYRDTKDVLSELKDRLVWRENEMVLDIGCGPGNTTAELLLPILPESAHLVGCDVSEDMVKFARKRFKNDRLSFTTLDVGADNVTEALGEERFDKVFSFYCLHWIPDQRKTVENIWKLMKPNGTALVTFCSRSPLFDLYKWMSKQPQWREYMMDVKNYITPYQSYRNASEQYVKILQSVGFKVIKCYDKYVTINTTNLHALEKCLEAVNPFLERMPPDIQKEHMKTIMKGVVDKGYVKIKMESSGSKNEDIELEKVQQHRLTIAFFQKASV